MTRRAALAVAATAPLVLVAACSTSSKSDPSPTTDVSTYVTQLDGQARAATTKVAPDAAVSDPVADETSACGKGGVSVTFTRQATVPGLSASTFQTVGSALQADGYAIKIEGQTVLADRGDGQGMSVIDYGDNTLRFNMITACGKPDTKYPKP